MKIKAFCNSDETKCDNFLTYKILFIQEGLVYQKQWLLGSSQGIEGEIRNCWD